MDPVHYLSFLFCVFVVLPSINSATSGLPSVRKCGYRHSTPTTVGGVNVIQGAYPWMVELVYDKGNSDGEFPCAGSLINSEFVLTAAHCVTNDFSCTNSRLKATSTSGFGSEIAGFMSLTKVADTFRIQARLGVHDLRNTTYPEQKTVNVVERIPHPDYVNNETHLLNDIGLIRIEKINYIASIKPVCLPSTADLSSEKEDESFEIVGWGSNGTYPQMNIKQTLKVNETDFEKCAQDYSKVSSGKQLANNRTTEMCTAPVPNRGTCAGDSGSPLLSLVAGKTNKKLKRYKIEGIVSSGIRDMFFCAQGNFSALITRVAAYDDWIRQTVRKARKKRTGS